jgi:undecaprenyl-phosphate 4-deoxy-4-formamido-L-arabinose transferase
MVISHSLIPLRILGVIGAVLAVYGAFMGLQVLIDVMSPDVKLSDIETLTSVTAFFRGFQLLAISVVGEYIGRIYLSLNSDPQFVIREKFQASRKSGIRTIAKAYLTDENHKTTNIQG